MQHTDRRALLRHAGLGLAAAGGGLVLSASARATPAVARADGESLVEVRMGALSSDKASGELRRAAPFSYGPFYKAGAPFRGKLSAPGEPGTAFVLSGRVWALDTRLPLAGAVLEVWHVDNKEKYSDGVKDLRNRGRLLSSEDGSYELECVRPIPYRPNASSSPASWRCAHFHLLAHAPGYAPLVTEIHFEGDAHADDPMYEPRNAIAVVARSVNGYAFESGTFDVVLARE